MLKIEFKESSGKFEADVENWIEGEFRKIEDFKNMTKAALADLINWNLILKYAQNVILTSAKKDHVACCVAVGEA